MAWTNIHKTVNANGGATIETGYWKEQINLLDWSDAANNGKSAYTTHLPFALVDDFTVLMYFSHDITGDTWIRIEHSYDGTNWTTAAQSGTTALTNTDLSGGTDISKIAFIDDTRQTENTTGYFFVYDTEFHGKSKYVRFAFEDNGAADDSGETITYYVIPH